MSRQRRLIVFCAGLLAIAGCSDEHRLPTGPPAAGSASPQPPSAPQRLAALALLDAASVHAGVTTSPLTWATWEGKVLLDGPCESGSGSFNGSLDSGSSPTSGTLLPTGNHTFVASFNNCLVGWWGVGLNGVASAAYNVAEWSNITATVSAESVRGWGLAFRSELNDVTADGSAVWTSVGTSSNTTTYTPAPGSRLVNNSTTNVATFGGGSYSVLHLPPPQGSSRRADLFDDLKIAINGTEYIINGSIDVTTATSGSRTHTGEVRITNNGTLVARFYGVRGALTIEVLVPLVPF